jgi:hypothetical protein
MLCLRVIAEDINVQALEAVRRRCAERKVSNVSILVGEPEDPKLPAGAVDLALMVNVFFRPWEREHSELPVQSGQVSETGRPARDH